MTDDTNDEATTGVSRRGALALFGLTGVGLLSAGSTGAKPANNVSLTIEDDLDLNGNDLINGDNFRPSSDYASFCTSGTGQGHSQLYDTAAETYFLRAFEGETDEPGPVEFQAPIKGARADSPGTTRPGPLRVRDGAVVDNLSVAGTNRIDVVADPTIDHTGDLAAEIQAYVDARETVNHLFVLPEGTYSWNTSLEVHDFEFVGVVGSPRATLAIETDDTDIAFELGTANGGGKRASVRNLTVDISAARERDAGIVKTYVETGATLENLTLRGRRYRRGPAGGSRYTVLANVIEASGHTTVKNVNLPDGDVETDDRSVGHAIPFSVDGPHVGTSTFEGCYVEGFVDNGFYVSNRGGRAMVQGCIAKNNGGGNIRLGDGDACRDSTIVLDDASDRRHPGCGLWLNGGSAVAENVTIEAPDADNDLIRVNSDADGGRISDTTVYAGADSDVYTVRITQGGNDVLEPVVLENVTIHDDVRYRDDRGYSIYLDRENVTFRDCDLRISEPDDRREGVYVGRSDVRFDGCTVAVANYGVAINLSATDVDLFGCRLRGTGSRSAGIAFSTDCDPATIETVGNRYQNVSVRDWIGSGVSMSDLN